MAYSIETTLERLARVISRQFNVDVVFEGNQAKTDGKKITLPYFSEITEEFEKDLNALLDHEVAHVKFTDFPDSQKVISKFHFQLLNAVEDVRIERLMVKDFPGTAYHLDPLNEKLKANIVKNWKNLPWPVKLQVAVSFVMDGTKLPDTSEIASQLEAIKEEMAQLNSCQSTKELREVTEKMVRKIQKDREEEKQQAKDQEQKEKAEKKNKEKNEASNGQENSQEKNGDKSEKKVDPKMSAKKEKHDEMISDGYADKSEKENKFEQHEVDIHSLINGQIEKMIEKEEEKAKKYRYTYEESKEMSIPTTTRFDREIDHSGKDRGYAKSKKQVEPMVISIRQSLERIFKVVENARWRSERERGLIQASSLAKMASNPNFRTIFKEQLKNETTNIAVSILIDLSGSMSGIKLETAKLAATAMSEALKGLDITFEVAGFHSTPCSKMSNYSSTIKETTRFSRRHEVLEHHVYKTFDSASLVGISHLESGGNNNDGESVLWMAKRLMERKEKRKVLIVMSDGMPAGEGGFGTLQNDLREKVKRIEKAGIETVGIGIQTDAVKAFYKDYVQVDKLSDLTGVAMKKLIQILTKNLKY